MATKKRVSRSTSVKAKAKAKVKARVRANTKGKRDAKKPKSRSQAKGTRLGSKTTLKNAKKLSPVRDSMKRDVASTKRGADATVLAKHIRVLIAKPGLDGHDRGAKVIARALRDAGFEVVYTGLHQTPEMIIAAALQEDVHVVGLSILSGAHNALVPEVISGLRRRGAKDVLFVVGGIIPDEDIVSLKKAGVHQVFTPGASLDSVIQYIKEHANIRVL